jgi:hypothetical protein
MLIRLSVEFSEGDLAGIPKFIERIDIPKFLERIDIPEIHKEIESFIEQTRRYYQQLGITPPDFPDIVHAAPEVFDTTTNPALVPVETAAPDLPEVKTALQPALVETVAPRKFRPMSHFERLITILGAGFVTVPPMGDEPEVLTVRCITQRGECHLILGSNRVNKNVPLFISEDDVLDLHMDSEQIERMVGLGTLTFKDESTVLGIIESRGTSLIGSLAKGDVRYTPPDGIDATVMIARLDKLSWGHVIKSHQRAKNAGEL